MPEYPSVELGMDADGNVVHVLPCYPQRHAYIENRIGKRFGDLLAGAAELDGGDAETVVRSIGTQAYELLCALIPNLAKRVPEHEFRGYGSRDAYEAGEYDERDDRSPTFPQIVAAFETAIKVNRFDLFAALKQFVDPKLLRAELSLWLTERLSTGSQNSPTPSGESRQSDSGTIDPISEDGSPHSVAAPVNGSGSLLTTSA